MIVLVKKLLDIIALIFLKSLEFRSCEPKNIESIKLSSWICKMCYSLHVAK